MAEISKSKKEAMLERLKGKYPDKNFEDEEELYGALESDYNEYEDGLGKSRANEEQLLGLFNKDPRSAAFLMSWKDGKDPLMAFIEEYGEDAVEALRDPSKREEYAASNSKYIEKMAANKKLQEEAASNLATSLDALDAAKEELGMDDEQANAAFELFDKVQDDAIVNKVTKETWMMFLKGLNFDVAVADAERTGEVRGKNSKIDETKKKKTAPVDLPPVIGGQAGEEKKAEKQELGVLNRFSGESIFERGRKRR